MNITKKFLSLFLTTLILVTGLSLTAFAEGSNSEEIIYTYSHEINGRIFIRVALDEKYKTFADDIQVILVEENYDREEMARQIYTGDDIKCIKEKTDVLGLKDTLSIYIPYAKNTKNNYIEVLIPENYVFDSSGNGNKELRERVFIKNYEAYRFECYSISHTNNGRLEYLKGDTVTYKAHFPVDFYLNDTLVAENSLEYKLDIKSHGNYKVEAKKFGITLETDDIDTKAEKKDAWQGLLVDSKTTALLALGSPVLIVLAALLTVIFPPLGIAALLSPFAAIGSFFVTIGELFEILIH